MPEIRRPPSCPRCKSARVTYAGLKDSPRLSGIVFAIALATWAILIGHVTIGHIFKISRLTESPFLARNAPCLIAFGIFSILIILLWSRFVKWKPILRCLDCRKKFKAIRIVNPQTGQCAEVHGVSIAQLKDARVLGGKITGICYAGYSTLEIEGEGKLKIDGVEVSLTPEGLEISGKHFTGLAVKKQEEGAEIGGEVTYWVRTIETLDKEERRQALCLLEVLGNTSRETDLYAARDSFNRFAAELLFELVPPGANVTGHFVKRGTLSLSEIEETFRRAGIEYQRRKKGIAFRLKNPEQAKFLVDYVSWAEVVPFALEERPLQEIRPLRIPFWGLLPGATSRWILKHTFSHKGDIFISTRRSELVAWHSSKSALEIVGKLVQMADKHGFTTSRKEAPWETPG